MFYYKCRIKNVDLLLYLGQFYTDVPSTEWLKYTKLINLYMEIFFSNIFHTHLYSIIIKKKKYYVTKIKKELKLIIVGLK